jgi:asparaginyl-tRNA synthetase
MIDKIFKTPELKEYTVKGWVRTARVGKNVSFVEIYDGSTLKGLQCVCFDKTILEGITTGCSVDITGELVESQGKGQSHELVISSFEILGACDESYPMQKKEHTMEFFREHLHLRGRTKLFQSIMTVRSVASQAVHEFFSKDNVHQYFTPILTSSDCEGAGETFELEDKEFFGKPSHLTISGQIELEYGALSMGNVYTFSPTFRAENSHTTKHLSEFWMLERESSFMDMSVMINDAFRVLKYVINTVREKCSDELDYLEETNGEFRDKFKPFDDKVMEIPSITYREAIEKLGLEWLSDIDTENEKKLVEMYDNKPVIITHFPSAMKPFYMKESGDSDDLFATVKGFDIIFPEVGELVGGSQREDSYEILKSKMLGAGLDLGEYDEYLDTRKYGTVEHAGYGIGFERLIMFLTGTKNIRDVIPFPRVPK